MPSTITTSVIELTNENFEQTALASPTPILVDFWAPWCGPCIIISSAVEELAAQWAGKILVGKVDVDEAYQITRKYGVLTIPTLILFVQGKAVERFNGVVTKSEIDRRVKNMLASIK